MNQKEEDIKLMAQLAARVHRDGIAPLMMGLKKRDELAGIKSSGASAVMQALVAFRAEVVLLEEILVSAFPNGEIPQEVLEVMEGAEKLLTNTLLKDLLLSKLIALMSRE